MVDGRPIMGRRLIAAPASKRRWEDWAVVVDWQRQRQQQQRQREQGMADCRSPSRSPVLISSRLLAGWAMEARKPYQVRAQVSSISDRTRQAWAGDATVGDGAGLLVPFCSRGCKPWPAEQRKAEGQRGSTLMGLRVRCAALPLPLSCAAVRCCALLCSRSEPIRAIRRRPLTENPNLGNRCRYPLAQLGNLSNPQGWLLEDHARLLLGRPRLQELVGAAQGSGHPSDDQETATQTTSCPGHL